MPDVDLSIQLLPEPRSILLSVGFMDNITAGVKAYGQGVNLIVADGITAGVRYGVAVPITAEIPSPTIDPPTDPLAMHVGQGAVFFSWDHPDPDLVQYYELLASASLAGAYEKYQQGEFQSRQGMIQNVPVGINAYFKLRAVGKNGAVSSLVQVKLGKRDPNPYVTLQGRAIQGSIIEAGAVFTVPQSETGVLIAMQCVNQITF